MREKGKLGKKKKILIRVDKHDKQLAEDLSHNAGMNTSEFIRHLLYEYEENQRIKLHFKLTEATNKLARDLKSALAMIKDINKG